MSKRDERKKAAAARARMTPAQVAAEKRARRQCGECQACCTSLAIPTLQKPRATRCPNQCATGCAIYEARPTECAGYVCLWREGWGIADDRPDKLGAVFDIDVNPALARVCGARGVNVTVKSGKSSDGLIRVHLRDESQPLTPLLRERIASFVEVGEGVVVCYTDRLVLYGPRCVAGLTLTLAELDALAAQAVGGVR